MATPTPPLHVCHVQKKSLIINRSHIILNLIAISFLIYYRLSSLVQLKATTKSGGAILSHVLVFVSELVLSFIWFLEQAYRWRPISRTVFPEHLPGDQELPGIDMFVCTADPGKEPALGVMNTVLSAMALDYPPDKVSVYLSDDGGSKVTLHAMREVWRFARWWLPFCRKYGVKTICPDAYFSTGDDDDDRRGDNEFAAKKENVEKKYEDFKERLKRIGEIEGIKVNRDHSPVVEVINERSSDEEEMDQAKMPLLVYVAREKRPGQPHHFKAGALNVLLRVSGMISNSPYILVLDCDMYCNNPASARQAMCFHLDPQLSPSLSHVQFPQKFGDISVNDIYGSSLRVIFEIMSPGFDGLKGPTISGSCFYIKRKALYGITTEEDYDLMKLRHSFGLSNEFIKSLDPNNRGHFGNRRDISGASQKDAQYLASCAYENHTEWGREVGFRYFSVVEDIFTAFILHCKGWTSVYINPQRPAFLGSATTSLNDTLVQAMRWSAGCAEIALSKFSPIIYGPLRMSVLQSMCYAHFSAYPFGFFPLWCLAIVPQLCLLRGIPLYPEVTNPFFFVFAYLFLLSQLKHIQEVLSTGGSIQSWMSEQRMWMTRNVTSYYYGTMNAIMETIGMREASFSLTNKVIDDQQVRRYQMDTYDFQTSNMFLGPMCTLVILNIASLIGGVVQLVSGGSCSEIFPQLFLCFFIVAMNYPIIEAMVLRKDNGRVPPPVTLFSTLLSVGFMCLGSFLLY